MKTTIALFAALCVPLAFIGCEGKQEKAGGDPSKPEPTHTATRSWASGGPSGGPSAVPSGSPVETPAVTATLGNIIPGDATAGSVSSTPSGATVSEPASGANTPSGAATPPGSASVPSGAIVSRKAAPCATMTVFNTGGNAVLMREQPQVGAAEIDALVEGTKVQGTEIVNDAFIAVTVGGKKGYVHGSFLTCNAQASAPTAPGNSGNPGVGTATDGSASAAVPSAPSVPADCLK